MLEKHTSFRKRIQTLQNSRNEIDGHETRAMPSYRRRYVFMYIKSSSTCKIKKKKSFELCAYLIWDEFILFCLEYLEIVSWMSFSRGAGVFRQVTCVAFCYIHEPFFLITPYIVINKRKCNCAFNKHLYGHLNRGVVDHREFLILHSNEPQARVAYF